MLDQRILTFTTRWANSTDNILTIFVLVFDILCKVPPNLHEMSKPIFLEKLRKTNPTKCRLLELSPCLQSVKHYENTPIQTN